MIKFKQSMLPLYISESLDQVKDLKRFENRVKELRKIGFDGIELAIRDPEEIDLEKFIYLLEQTQIKVAALGTGRAYAVDGLSFTHADENIRNLAVERIKKHIDFSHNVGIPPVIIGLIRGNAESNANKSTAMTLLLHAMKQCAEYALNLGVRIALEPINRYETNLINTVDEGLNFIDKLGYSNVGLLIDTFHMNIEERNTSESIRKANNHIFHFHVADSNRYAPGWGHLDFSTILCSLQSIQYDGYISGEILHGDDALLSAQQTYSHIKEIEMSLSQSSIPADSYYYVSTKDRNPIQHEGHYSYSLLTAENGCVNGCSSGISVYTTDEFLHPGVHEDQEGFLVLEGHGWASIGDKQFPIEPEMSIIVPAGVEHSIRKNKESQSVKLFWFHCAV